MLPIIQIGPLAIQTAGLILVIGFWLALELSGRQARRAGLDPGVVQNAGLVAVLLGIIAARLAYVAQYWPVFRQNLLGIVSLNPQTLSAPIGIAAGLLAAAAYLRHKKVPLRLLLDSIAPGATLLLAALSLANLARGTAFGTQTSLPWAIAMWDALRHPIQLYEFVASLVILALLLTIVRRPPAPGLRFLLFVALYAAMRLLIDPLRATGHILPGGFRTAQVLGLTAALSAMALMRAWSRPPQGEESGDPVAQ
jgi:prolipoprotein diacylglyceryltransferase